MTKSIIIFIVLLAFSANALQSHSRLRNLQTAPSTVPSTVASTVTSTVPVPIVPAGFTLIGSCIVPKLSGNWICNQISKTNCCTGWSSIQCLGVIDPTTGVCPFQQLIIECSIGKDITKGLKCQSL